MKTTTILLLTIVIALTSCSNQNEKTEELSSTTQVNTFPIGLVRQNSQERNLIYNLDSLDVSKLIAIDSVFFTKWLENISVNNFDFKIKFDGFSSYYFFDFIDQSKMFLFSIIQDDENGYRNLFHFTFDKIQNKIMQADFIVQNGGDGGYLITSILNYNKSGDILKVISISTYDEDFDYGYTRQFDSTLTKVEFNLQKTNYFKIDSLSRIDTIWAK
jgi:hypothetical protein